MSEAHKNPCRDEERNVVEGLNEGKHQKHRRADADHNLGLVFGLRPFAEVPGDEREGNAAQNGDGGDVVTGDD